MVNQNFENLKIQYGKTAAILKIEKLRYLRNHFSILRKFWTITHIRCPEFTSCSKFQILKIQDVVDCRFEYH